MACAEIIGEMVDFWGTNHYGIGQGTYVIGSFLRIFGCFIMGLNL